MEHLRPLLGFLGVNDSDTALPTLQRYADWLVAEAIPAGGLGPNEEEHILDRHIADSLAFGAVWLPDTEVLDVGTGVGLPGLPLAIAHPRRQFHLVDRAGRRIELLKRAVRILEVPNVTVHQQDAAPELAVGRSVVARASLPPADLAALVGDVARETLVAASRTAERTVPGFDTVEVRHEILLRPAFFLRMRQT